MTRHRLKRNAFRLGDGAEVTIEYWIDSTSVSVAAFGADGHRISRAEYSASVESADDLDSPIQESLVDSLANALEYELINHPDIHVRRR